MTQKLVLDITLDEKKFLENSVSWVYNQVILLSNLLYAEIQNPINQEYPSQCSTVKC